MDGLRWLPYLNVPKWLIPAAHQGAIQANPVAGWLNTGGQVRRNCQLRLLDRGERIHAKIAFRTVDDVVSLVTYRFRRTTCFARIAANARFRIDQMLPNETLL